MYLECWRPDSWAQLQEGDEVGWASSQEEAQEQAELLTIQIGRALYVVPVLDEGLFEHYWWPEDWPSREAFAIIVDDEDQ